jgi:hypothetical protein
MSRKLDWLVRAIQIQPGRSRRTTCDSLCEPWPDGWAVTTQLGLSWPAQTDTSYAHRKISTSRAFGAAGGGWSGRLAASGAPRRMVSLARTQAGSTSQTRILRRSCGELGRKGTLRRRRWRTWAGGHQGKPAAGFMNRLRSGKRSSSESRSLHTTGLVQTARPRRFTLLME